MGERDEMFEDVSNPCRRDPRVTPAALAWITVMVLLTCGAARVVATPAPAARPTGPPGKIAGRVVGSDTGEGVSFCEVILLPADSTARKIGTHSNSDGTYVLEAPAGRYALQFRALSYDVKRIEGVAIAAGQTLGFNAALKFHAIQQVEVVVESRTKKSSDVSMLTVRKRAIAVGDAVSAEQVKKSPDKDAGEVLRRVTGLSVSSGKYVYVRGLGERYSSTQIDGVRIASPEQNKRVVPMDLIPATLLENIVVQKTYTADLPGEFGGGDIQVSTRNFPGRRMWSVAAGQSLESGVTFHSRSMYGDDAGDAWGYGASRRRIPAAVSDIAGSRPLLRSSNPTRGFTLAQLATVARSFDNVWTPRRGASAAPNQSVNATYGDEFRVLGRSIGVIEALSFTRGFDAQDESQRFFADGGDTLYDYAVHRQKESVQLGAISGLSARLATGHTVHARGFYNNSGEDEVRTYEGVDHNRIESVTGNWLTHRATRLRYVERSVFSGSLEGTHAFPSAHLDVTWRLNSSHARQQQPDRRETIYDQHFYDDGSGRLVDYWVLGSNGLREYGDLSEDGRGRALKIAMPYRLAGLGNGKLQAGYDRQAKDRDSFYRRFNFHQGSGADITAAPESIFAPSGLDGSAGSGWVEEATLAIDNYRACSVVEAAFVSADIPLGARVRGNLGVRREFGLQDVRTFDLFDPAKIVAEGRLRNTDWLPAGNLAVEIAPSTNLRLAASRTVSRPDLNELSPSPSLEYVGGFQVAGNPQLRRATIANYDIRLETFPSLSEVFAVGGFYKAMDAPIEQVIQAGAPPVLVPRNSDRGHNVGLELEARAALLRLAPWLHNFFLNSNASIIHSDVRLEPQISKLGSEHHPLQGQAKVLANASLSYAAANGRRDVTVLLGVVGTRLRALGLHPLPDVYAQPTTSLDVTVNAAAFTSGRLKLSAKNLLDPRVRELQGDREVSGYRDGRRYAVSFSYGS